MNPSTSTADAEALRRADGSVMSRDLAATRTVLEKWLRDHLPGHPSARVTGFSAPEGGGSSNETILFDAALEGGQATAGLVLRVKPTGFRAFYQDTFANEYKVLELLGRNTDVPVPTVYGYEEDPGLLGAPFWIMDRVAGENPADNPPYNVSGFLADARPQERRRLWESAIKAMAKLHACDPGDLSFLAESRQGANGLEQLLNSWREAASWVLDGGSHPLLAHGWQWLWENRPAVSTDALSWGDARIGNMLFDDFTCAAVLDWEMLSLGGPLVDLGYFIFMERTWPPPRLEGLGTSEEAVGIWEAATGLTAANLDWYQALAAYRLSVTLLGHFRAMGHPFDLDDVAGPQAPAAGQEPSYDDLASPARFFKELARYTSS